MHRKLLAVGLASLSLAQLAGCDRGEDAEEAARQAAARIAAARAEAEAVPTDPSTLEGFVAQLAIGDLYAVESSRLALTRSKSPDVRAIAVRVVADHTASTARLRELIDGGQVDGPSLPTALDDRRLAMIEALRAADDAAFDAAYLSQQADAHREALVVVKAYEDAGSGLLRSLAQDLDPKVQAHLDMITALGRAS